MLKVKSSGTIIMTIPQVAICTRGIDVFITSEEQESSKRSTPDSCPHRKAWTEVLAGSVACAHLTLVGPQSCWLYGGS